MFETQIKLKKYYNYNYYNKLGYQIKVILISIIIVQVLKNSPY